VNQVDDSGTRSGSSTWATTCRPEVPNDRRRGPRGAARVGEVVTGEDGCAPPAERFQRGVGGVLGPAAGEPAQHLLGFRRAEPQHLLLHGDLARAEPKTLGYPVLHVAARFTRGQCRLWLRNPTLLTLGLGAGRGVRPADLAARPCWLIFHPNITSGSCRPNRRAGNPTCPPTRTTQRRSTQSITRSADGRVYHWG
jgi:hypothetical protein